MFGLIKENILNDLEKTFKEGNKSDFKTKYNKFTKIIKNNKDLKELYEVYNLINSVSFNDYDVAKEFIEESVKYLKLYNKTDLNILKNIINEVKDLSSNDVNYKIDQLVFNENLPLDKKAQYKVDLINNIFNKDVKKTDLAKKIDESINKINSNINNLDDDKKNLLNLYLEGDNNKINNHYNTLLNEVETAIDDKIINTVEDDLLIKKLVEVKKKVTTYKKSDPTISKTEDLIELKRILI